jgi:hypothetical protein
MPLPQVFDLTQIPALLASTVLQVLPEQHRVSKPEPELHAFPVAKQEERQSRGQFNLVSPVSHLPLPQTFAAVTVDAGTVVSLLRSTMQMVKVPLLFCVICAFSVRVE